MRSAVGPLSSNQSKAGGAKESDPQEEEPAYPVKRLHQPTVTFLLMAHYSRAVTYPATLAGDCPVVPRAAWEEST